METGKAERMALAALLTGAVCIGIGPVFVRLSSVGPSATAFYRLLFALPVLWLWLGMRRSHPSTKRPATRHDFLLLITAGLFFTADLAVWHWSLQFTSVANSTLLSNFAPVFVTIGAAMFLGERITRGFVAGMIVAFVGAVLLVSERLQFRQQEFLGNSLALLTAVFYAGYMLTIKALRDRFTTPTIMAWSGLVACASLLVVAVLSREVLVPEGARGWLVVIALALVSHLGGQTLITQAMGHLPASFSSVTLLLQPIISALLAWVLLKEALTLWQWIGGAIILGGIFLAGRKPGRSDGPEKPEQP